MPTNVAISRERCVYSPHQSSALLLKMLSIRSRADHCWLSLSRTAGESQRRSPLSKKLSGVLLIDVLVCYSVPFFQVCLDDRICLIYNTKHTKCWNWVIATSPIILELRLQTLLHTHRLRPSGEILNKLGEWQQLNSGGVAESKYDWGWQGDITLF